MGHDEQTDGANELCTLNSYEVLIHNDSVEVINAENDADKKLELVGGNTVSKPGQTSYTGSIQKQQNSNTAGARVKEQISGKMLELLDFKVSKAGQNNSQCSVKV